MTDPMEHNRALWDEWTRIHVTAEFYDAQSFRDGTRTNRLRPYEIEEIGDVRGRDLVHLQCHSARHDRRVRSAHRVATRIPVPRVAAGLLEERDDGIWTLPADQDGKLPLYFSMKTTKPA